MTRPEVLAAGVLMPAALWLWLSRRDARRPSSRRLAAATLVFFAGMTLVMGPWMLRNRVKHGVWALSANAGDLLYAASSPRYRAWSPEVSSLAEGMNIHDRVVFFNAGVRRNLHQYPGFYLKNAAEHTARISRAIVHRTPLMVALPFLVAVALAGASDRRRRIQIAIAGCILAFALWIIPEAYLYWLWLIGLALALVRRAPILILGALVVSPVLLLGMTAISADFRFFYALEVPAFALAVWVLASVLALCGDRVKVGWPADEWNGWGRVGVFARKLAITVILVLAVGMGKAVWARRGVHVPRAPTVLDGDAAARWIGAALDAPDARPYLPLRPRLEVRTAVFRSDYTMHFGAGEFAPHWNPIFNIRRRYPFSVAQMRPSRFEPRPLPGPEHYAVFPGDLVVPAGRRLVLVGIRMERPMQGTSFEVIAVGEDAAGAALARPSASVAALHAGELGASVATGR